MTLLFSGEGCARLDEVARPGLLCAFDFDGTLAPIVVQPEQAQLPGHIREHLLTLSRFAPVAIITGRSVGDIRSRLGFDPDFIIGNHGLEGIPGWETDAGQHHALCAGWRGQLAQALDGNGFDPAIQVEDKHYSLSVHYRRVRDTKETTLRLRRMFATLDPIPRVISGKYVFNLVPQDAAHKGKALARLMKMVNARHAIYAGDDVTDEDAFRLPRQQVLSVRIEHAPRSAAEFYLAKRDDIIRLLTELIDRLQAHGAVNWVQSAATPSAR